MIYRALDEDCVERGELELHTHPNECGLASSVGYIICTVLWLLPEMVTCRVQSGQQRRPHVYLYCSSSLTCDLPSIVWPGLYALLILCLLLVALPLVYCCHVQFWNKVKD